MYIRDTIKTPQQIERNAFVEEIFYLGTLYQHSYDTILMSVKIGDSFCNSDREVKLWTNEKIKLKTPSEKIYSNELAHVCTVIASNINEDCGHGYRSILSAAKQLENNFVHKLFCELCLFFDYKFPREFIMTSIIEVLGYKPEYKSLYLEITKDICELSLNTKEKSIVKQPKQMSLVILWLLKQKKLSATTRLRKSKFIELILLIHEEFQIEIPTILREFKSYYKTDEN